MDGWSATIILALIGLFNIFGTLGIGYLGTKYRKKNLLSILYALRAVSICVFIFSPPSLLNSIIFGITFGLLMAVYRSSNKWNCRANIWNKIFKHTFWNCISVSPIWCFLRSLSWRIFL